MTFTHCIGFEVNFPSDLFPNRLHPNAIDRICDTLPALPEPVGEAFREQAEGFAEEALSLIHI